MGEDRSPPPASAYSEGGEAVDSLGFVCHRAQVSAEVAALGSVQEREHGETPSVCTGKRQTPSHTVLGCFPFCFFWGET